MLIARFVLGSLFTLTLTRNSRGLKPSTAQYRQLCDSLSEKATKQRLKLCHFAGNSVEALRKRRDVNTTLPRSTAQVSNPAATNKERSLDSYVCKDFKVDTKHGYDVNGDGIELNVTFFRVNDEWPWKAIISWDPPKRKNRSNCIGYHITWHKSDGGPFDSDYCDIIMNENITSYTIDSSKGWKHNPDLGVAVYPLPKRRLSWTSWLRWFSIPPPSSEEPSKPTSSSLDSTKNHSAVSPREPMSNPPENTKNYSEHTEKESETKTSTTNTTNFSCCKGSVKKDTSSSLLVAAATTAAVGVVIVVALSGLYWTVRKRRKYIYNSDVITNPSTENNKKSGDRHYISYYADNESTTQTAIKITCWLRQQNINVIMDKFYVVTNERIWNERNMSLSKRVILIISPGYLEICKFDEKNNKEKRLESVKDQLAYSEISRIRNEIMEKPLATDRFIVILVRTSRSDLPFWMKKLKIYEYSRGMLDEKILTVLKV